MSYKKYITHRVADSFPKYVEDEIKLLSVSTKDPAIPFGSSVYRIQMYPGDIDLIEHVVDSGTKERIVKKFLVDFKKIVKNIQKSRLHYYSEVKAGIDELYDIDIGTLENGIYTVNPNLHEFMERYHNFGLITNIDYTIIMRAINNKTAAAYDVINYIIREYRILRWSIDEILKGKKVVAGDTIDLEQITMQTGFKTLFKIDEIALFQNRFAEYTNVYFISNIDKQNIIGSVTDIDSELKEEIEKLYYSDMYYNPFKIIKRMFALAQSPSHNTDPRFTRLIRKLDTFISSKTSMLYQIKSQLEAISVILEKSKSIPTVTINKQIDEMKFRISSYLQIKDSSIDKINDVINKIVASNGDMKIKMIKILKKILTDQLINRSTIIFMNKNKINPPPDFILPQKRKYSRGIVRTPRVNPINPLELFEKNIIISDMPKTADDEVSVYQDLANKIIDVDDDNDFSNHVQPYIRNIVDIPPDPFFSDEYDDRAIIDQIMREAYGNKYDELDELDDNYDF